MPNCIFEIGFEEMPARFLPHLAEEAKQRMAEGLTERELGYGAIWTHVTPRRLAVYVQELDSAVPTSEQTFNGPPASVAFAADGTPTKALTGFAAGHGLGADDVFVVQTDKGEYVAVTRTVGGEPARDVLAEVCPALISRLSFPKRMRWSTRDEAFGRPVRWLTCLLGSDVVEFSFAGIASGRKSMGHRVMGEDFELTSADEYLTAVREKGGVGVDPDERARIIDDRGNALAAEQGGSVVWDDGLLAEVCGLVEHPVPVIGTFDESFLELPREVLLTSMQSHQKSFGVEKPNGSLLPCFLTVLNITPKSEPLVRKGWERVLRARLEDARFFWKEDNGVDFDTWLGKLEHVTFLAPLGSMGHKARRIEKLAGWLAERIAPQELLTVSQAGLYAKADLVSEMVGEFDSLQGKMGGIYARRKGFNSAVADAIYDHYLPTGPDSPTPGTLPGALVALADKLDTLCGAFALNMVPTGAADPYALRRACLGVCRIIMDRKLPLSLSECIDAALGCYDHSGFTVAPDEVQTTLIGFFGQRLRAHFGADGVETLVVEAALGAGFDDIAATAARVRALDAFSTRPGFEQAVLTFKRVANIIRKQGGDVADLGAPVDKALLTEDAEKQLAATLDELEPRFATQWQAGEFDELLGLLDELRPRVDGFFDSVMVMSEDEAVRANRLRLLGRITAMLGRLADFTAFQV